MKYPKLYKLAQKSNNFENFLKEAIKFIKYYEIPNIGIKADYQAFYIEVKGE